MLIYSIGPDRADNGGAIDRRKGAAGADWGFRLRDR
jgi:hypothetical protein